MLTSHITNSKPLVTTPVQPQQVFELYQVIIHCRTEAEQRRLFDRLRRKGYRSRLTVL